MEQIFLVINKSWRKCAVMYLNVSRKGWKDILDLFFGIIVTKESYEMQGNASGLRPQDLLYCRFYFFFYFFFFTL